MKLNKQSAVLLAVAMLLLGACSSTPTPQSYYLLEAGKDATNTMLSGKPAMSIRRVRLPGYLAEKGIARKVGDGRIEVSLTDLWIEPLTDAVPQVLAEELGFYLKQPVMVHPIPAGHDIDTILEVDIDSWIGDSSSLSMSANYRLVTPNKLISNSFSQQIALADSSQSALVNAHQQLLKALAQAIAESLNQG